MNWVKDTFRTILQTTLILTYGRALLVIKVGKFFYIGRSEDGEDEKDGNRSGSSDADTFHRLIELYHQTCQTLNIIRAFSSGVYSDINRLCSCYLNFMENTDDDSR